MAVLQPPAFVATGCYEAQSFRQLVAAMTGGKGGIVQGLAATVSAGPTFALAAGSAVVRGTTTPEGAYLATNLTSLTGLTAPAAHATLYYVGYIVARVQSTENGDASNLSSFEVVAGTPAASPVLPTLTGRRTPIYTFMVRPASLGGGVEQLTGIYVSGQFVGLPVGAVVPMVQVVAPEGFIQADGSPFDPTAYPALATAVGTAYGIDGGTGWPRTPDMRGRFPLGYNGTTYPQGATGGAATVTLTVASMPAHNHAMATAGAHTHLVRGSVGTGSGTNGLGLGLLTAANDWDGVTNSAGAHSHTINNNGGGGSHENMPPYLVMRYYIRAA